MPTNKKNKIKKLDNEHVLINCVASNAGTIKKLVHSSQNKFYLRLIGHYSLIIYSVLSCIQGHRGTWSLSEETQGKTLDGYQSIARQLITVGDLETSISLQGISSDCKGKPEKTHNRQGRRSKVHAHRLETRFELWRCEVNNRIYCTTLSTNACRFQHYQVVAQCVNALSY